MFHGGRGYLMFCFSMFFTGEKTKKNRGFLQKGLTYGHPLFLPNNTIVSIITNIIQTALVLVVMLNLEWRLTLVSIIILPLFILAARRLGGRLRDIARLAMEYNAQMNAMMNETLNISGALLVKLFGRAPVEVKRFDGRAAKVRDIGIRRAGGGAVL